jgi:hypothetical protein
MHVTQDFNYKGDRITGVVENTQNKQANAVQAFLIFLLLAVCVKLWPWCQLNKVQLQL